MKYSRSGVPKLLASGPRKWVASAHMCGHTFPPLALVPAALFAHACGREWGH